MRRRQLLGLIGGAAVWSIPAGAQRAALPEIGFLNAISPEFFAPYLATFRQGLSEVGYVEARNVAIEYRWARGQYGLLPALASELVARRVAVIAATGGARSAIAAKATTAEIPIIFAFGDGDPVTHGLVRSFNDPGTNATGVTMIAGLMGTETPRAAP